MCYPKRERKKDSGPEIAKAVEICSLLAYLLVEKPIITLTLNLKPRSKKVKNSHMAESVSRE